jgi:hypothetical protein
VNGSKAQQNDDRPYYGDESGVPVFDPWADLFHVDGDKAALKAPVTIEAVARITLRN